MRVPSYATVYWYWRSGVSVCVLVTTMSSVKTDEPIDFCWSADFTCISLIVNDSKCDGFDSILTVMYFCMWSTTQYDVTRVSDDEAYAWLPISSSSRRAWPITAAYVILSHRGPNEPCRPKLFSEVRIGATWWIRWIDLCSGSDAVCRCHYCSRRAYQPAWRSLRYRPMFRTRCRVSQMSLEFVVITNLFQHFTATLKCIDRCNRTVKDNKHVCFCCVEFSFFGTSLWHRCKKRSNKNKKTLKT